MKRTVVFILLVMQVAILVGATRGSGTWQPSWASGSKGLGGAGLSSTREVKIYSPDHRSLIDYRNLSLKLYVNGKEKLDLTHLIGSIYLIEIDWSSDSNAFFVNASDGGLVGNWSTHIYEIDKSNVLEIPLHSLIKTSSLRTDCDINSVSLAWLHGHRKLLILQQVPDASDCRNMGKVAGYVVDFKSRSVVRYLTTGQIKMYYSKYLGSQSKSSVSGADDE